MVRFPFTTRGEMDDDPVLKHGREAFPALFARLLAQPTGMSPDDFNQTERQLLQETVRLPSQEAELSKDGSFRIGTFVFQQIDGAWKLAHGYTDEP